MKDILIIHHSPCSDGSAAAAIVSMNYRIYRDQVNSVELMGTTYGRYELIVDDEGLRFESYRKSFRIDSNTEIIVVDFSFKRDEIMTISAVCHSLLILDHHKTAAEDLAGDFPENVEIVFDMNRSGAMLAWDRYMQDALGGPAPYSRFIQLVGMRDLWKHKGTDDQEDAEAVQLALNSRENKFDAAGLEMYVLNEVNFKQLLSEGKMLLRFFDSQLKEAIRNAVVTVIGEPNIIPVKTVSVCNASGMMASELGNRLCEQGNNFAAIWSLDNAGDVRVSMRSIGDNDCTEVARHFGGGGHKNAAGFRASLYEFLDYFKMLYLLKF